MCFFHFLKNELKINRILIPFTRYFIIIDDIQYSQENSKLFGNYLIEANEFDQFDVWLESISARASKGLPERTADRAIRETKNQISFIFIVFNFID